jgi:hypothetical protein
VGTIKEVQFTSPHVWLQVLVPGARGGRPSGASRRARQACCCARVGSRPHSKPATGSRS